MLVATAVVRHRGVDTMKSKLGAVLVAGCVLLPLSANADTITRTFTVSVPDPTHLLSIGNNFAGTPFAEFDPALGTLTQVVTLITAPATFLTSSGCPELYARLRLEGLGDLGSIQVFSTKSTINFNLGNVNSSSTVLVGFTGTGNAIIDLNLFDNSFYLGGQDGIFTTDG